MTSPTQVLRDEHTLILRALDVLDEAVADEASTPLPEGWWSQLAAWLRRFADEGHHAKEETLLFPALLEAGLPAEGGPVAVMLAEHAEGRGLVAAIDATAGTPRATAARAYARLLRAHIDKENFVLFPLADELVDADRQRALEGALARLDGERGSQATLGYAEAVLEGLTASLTAQ